MLLLILLLNWPHTAKLSKSTFVKKKLLALSAFFQLDNFFL